MLERLNNITFDRKTMLNIEIKARTQNPDHIKSILENLGADYQGIDHQIDTYFVVPDGRLKLRQGNIENSLIFYQRPNQAGPKASNFLLYHPEQENSDKLKKLLTTALGQKVIVDKHRAIYFFENVKFHVDQVVGLGDFMEIEVMDTMEMGDIAILEKQCKKYMGLFGIEESDLINGSYSDLLANS